MPVRAEQLLGGGHWGGAGNEPVGGSGGWCVREENAEKRPVYQNKTHPAPSGLASKQLSSALEVPFEILSTSQNSLCGIVCPGEWVSS